MARRPIPNSTVLDPNAWARAAAIARAWRVFRRDHASCPRAERARISRNLPTRGIHVKKLVIGLTGGIGSGKSAVSRCFEDLGIVVIDADKAARVVVEPGTPALAQIAEHFGNGILDTSGALDRAALRRIVFSDAEKRKWLEGVLHPRITIEIFKGLREATSPYAILASPLLFEARQDSLANRVLVVDVDESTQLRRTMERDANTEQQVRAIMASQIARSERLARADDVIENNGTLAELRPQVAALHERYLVLAAELRRRGADTPPAGA
ncbi:MAG: dephospho-CoA kinase [Pseudomonadales bacterium]|nr:dephospho-CoA kinase [Gammaproteobacteria bacterium]MBK9665312.1 dephospho-CoA kinase [Gammaproteobacteria bacterium]MBP6053367.1 dephospho-CoA kinase [Pseudomonadales bacterium]MBP6229259.1 dephospho-CoA kinase [Pseudomonadales bacterium]